MNSKKRNLIFESVRPKKRKPIDDYESDESSGDIMPEKSSALELPGGTAKSLNPYESNCKGSGVGEAPRELVYNIRKYLDILLSSAVLEAKYLTSSEVNKPNSIYAIPGIVSSILEYNNIAFKTIKYCITRSELFEPVWYTYSVRKNELILYINESMYEEFCSKNSRDPVIFTSGIVPVEVFNPYETNPDTNNMLEASIIHCAIASDHVAQHIISDLYGSNPASCADIHDKFGEVGTTLHSMFYLEKSCSKIPKHEYSNYLTIAGHSQTPMLRSTRRLIDNLVSDNIPYSDNFSYKI